MEALFKLYDNTVIAEVLVEKILISVLIFVPSLVFGYLMIKSYKNELEEEDYDEVKSDSLSDNNFAIELGYTHS